MNVKQQAAVFGTVVAAIVCAGIVWGLRRLADAWPMSAWVAFVGVSFVCLLLLAWRLDKRASSRAKRGQSDPT